MISIQKRVKQRNVGGWGFFGFHLTIDLIILSFLYFIFSSNDWSIYVTFASFRFIYFYHWPTTCLDNLTRPINGRVTLFAWPRPFYSTCLINHWSISLALSTTDLHYYLPINLHQPCLIIIASSMTDHRYWLMIDLYHLAKRFNDRIFSCWKEAKLKKISSLWQRKVILIPQFSPFPCKGKNTRLWF